MQQTRRRMNNQGDLRTLEVRGIHQTNDRKRRYDQKGHRHIFQARQISENIIR